MDASALIPAVIIVAALLQWLFFGARVLFRANTASETSFKLSTMAMAVVWMCIAAAWSVSRPAGGGGTVQRAGCAAIREGVSVSEVEKAVGSASRKVPEGDTRGPGAEAWVYEDAGCIAHVLDNRVRSVEAN